jgi:CRP-like cAMP-binding protein
MSKWPRNRLLAALPSRHLKRLMQELEHIPYQGGEVLIDAEAPLDQVYFPESGVISMVAVYADGSSIETATVGREGCTGVQAIFGAKRSTARLLVQIPGSATRMPRASFRGAIQSMPSFRSLLETYAEAFLEQVMVAAACNGAHNLKQRLSRWLLMMHDRSDGDTLPITQDLLAVVLGVQRPTITIAARELESKGFIKRGRRQLTIVSRRGLIEESCQCYQMVRKGFSSRLPQTYM